MSEKKARKSRIPQPFAYRGGWRAQVTLKNGTRPFADFTYEKDAGEWITDTLANANSDQPAALGGPTQATLCDMLEHYLHHYCLAKGGVAQEIDRANHYLAGAGRPKLALVVNAAGQKSIVPAEEARKLKVDKQKQQSASAKSKVGGNAAGEMPVSFDAHNKARVASHPNTYAMYARLAVKTASCITKDDMSALHTAMTAEGYSESTIQKEIALLKAMFNTARGKWEWKGFENPCVGIKLKAAPSRIVVVTKDQRERLLAALAECDNPEFWPFVDLTLATTQRQHSLLGLEWARVDLENRVMQVYAKGDWAVVPLSKRAVALLEGLPGERTGMVFTMTKNAVDCAWDGVRIKAGLPKMHFHDLRHVGATDFARAGFNSHQLRKVLAHKTTHMADIYVNFGSQDVQEAMDAVGADTGLSPMPPAGADRTEMLNAKKAKRLAKVKVIDPEGEKAQVPEVPQETQASPASNVVQFRPRALPATGLPGRAAPVPDAGGAP
jgi:integrase